MSAGRYLAQGVEGLTGGVLGGAAGYASEKKDSETGKRSPGRRTLSGALAGTGAGLLGGQALRYRNAVGSMKGFGAALRGDPAPAMNIAQERFVRTAERISDSNLSDSDKAARIQALTSDLLMAGEEAGDKFRPFGLGAAKKAPRVYAEAEKLSSLAEYSVLFDAIDSGALGSHVKEAMIGVCEGISSSVNSNHLKLATAQKERMSEQDARQARIDQLLRRI